MSDPERLSVHSHLVVSISRIVVLGIIKYENEFWVFSVLLSQKKNKYIKKIDNIYAWIHLPAAIIML